MAAFEVAVMSPDLKQIFESLFVLLREKNTDPKKIGSGLRHVVMLLHDNEKLQNELGKLFAKVYAKQEGVHLSPYGVIFEKDKSEIVPVQKSESAVQESPARTRTREDQNRKHKWDFKMPEGTAKSCKLVIFACNLLYAFYALWSQFQFITLSTKNSNAGLVTYKINPTSILSLLPNEKLNETLHELLNDAKFAHFLRSVVYSNDFMIGPLDKLILQNSPQQISPLKNVQLQLDFHVLYTDSKLGGVRDTKPHARTLQDIWKTYSVVNRTAVSDLKWDLAARPAALEVVRANYDARVKTVLSRALQTVKMYFANESMPPVLAAYAQQVATRKRNVSESTAQMRFEWVLVRDLHNADDIQALHLFILNICETLNKKTDMTQFEKRILNMAQLFRDVYAKLEKKSKNFCATVNAPDFWQTNSMKSAAISMLDLHTDAFTKRLVKATAGERHDVFIYEMISYEPESFYIDWALTKMKTDVEMHILFEVFLHGVSFECTNYPGFAWKPIFIGYYLLSAKGTNLFNNVQMHHYPHYMEFAQSDELLYQLVPLLLPRKWKAVSGDAVSRMAVAADLQALQFTDFEPCISYNLDLQEMFASDTYELTPDAYAKHRSRLFYDNMYIHVSTGTKGLFLVPYTSTHIEPHSFLSFVASELQRGLSANVFHNLVHAKADIWSKIPLQLELLVNIVQDQIFPQLSWNTGTIITTVLLLYFNPARVLVTLMMRWLEKIYDKATKNLSIFNYIIACLLTMMFFLFKFLDITSSQVKGIPKLEALIGSFDMVGFLDIIVDLFFVGCNMYQFSVECGDSFNIPDTLGYYNSNFPGSRNQQEMKNCFVNKNTLDDLLSTMHQCSDDLEAHFDALAPRANSVRDNAEIVVGYCRVLSLRMLVLYLRQLYHKQTYSMQEGTFGALKKCHKKLSEFYNKHRGSINDETIIQVNTSTNTTVHKFKQFFKNAYNDEHACTSMQMQLQTLLVTVNSPMKNGDETTHSMLKNLTFFMLGFFIKQRACLVMLAQFAEGESQRRAQHKLYNHFKHQASVHHDALFARCLAICTAVFEMQYYGSLLYCYYARPPGSFVKGVRLVQHSSDDIVRTFRDASGITHRLRLHRSAFSDTVRQEIEKAERDYVPMIASAVEKLTADDSDSARSGSAARSDATDREELHAGSDSAEEDAGAATGAAARPDAPTADKATYLQPSLKIKNLKADLTSVVRDSEKTPAKINNVLAQLNDAFSKSTDKMNLPFGEFFQVFNYKHIDDETKNLCLTMLKMYVEQNNIVKPNKCFNICVEKLKNILETNVTSQENLNEMLSALAELSQNSTPAARGRR